MGEAVAAGIEKRLFVGGLHHFLTAGPDREDHRESGHFRPFEAEVESFKRQFGGIEVQRGVADNKRGVGFAEHGSELGAAGNELGPHAIFFRQDDAGQHDRGAGASVGSQRFDFADGDFRDQQNAANRAAAGDSGAAEIVEFLARHFNDGHNADIGFPGGKPVGAFRGQGVVHIENAALRALFDAPDQRNRIQVADRADARLMNGGQIPVYHLRLRISGQIAVAGNLVEDILVRPVRQIEYGFTVWVESIEHHLGGNGANTSYTLATLGVPVRLRGAVGRDETGDRVLARLKSAGVDLEEVARMDLPTATTVVLVAPDASRSFLHAPGVSKEVFAEPGKFGSGPGHFHLANIYSLPNMRRTGPETLAGAHAAGWTTSLDTGHDTRGEWMKVLEPCLPYIGVLFANEAEALKISGLDDLRAAARLFLDRGVKTAVIKRGSNGCAVFHEEGEFWARGFPVQPVDTTGAGDCFTGGFLAGLSKGETLQDAARLANACGALSASKMGSVSGLRGYQETLNWMAGAGTEST